ncbi:hypothetical protein FJY69_04720 [candidate division WOR-3 bacterium]|nr:hypothetical protein [candidate division WOR-3 bacterium]
MAKTPANHGKDWASTDVAGLGFLARQNTPTRVIGIKLGRTPDSMMTKAWKEDISLKPTNQSPYRRRKR